MSAIAEELTVTKGASEPELDSIQQERVRFVRLPLAVYREIAAHLQQVKGVTTKLISQSSPQFDYAESQVEALEMCYQSHLPTTEKQFLEDILDYYRQRYGEYQRDSSS